VMDMAAAIFGRLCSGSIQKGSFINRDRENDRIQFLKLDKNEVKPSKPPR
jgi:hypothetical protein